MRKIHNYIIFSILLVIAGCSLGPKFQAPDMGEPQTFNSDSIPYDSLRSDTMLNLRWWEIFNDPTLEELIKTGLNNNKNVLIAASRIEEARAALGFTKANSYPFFDFQAGAGTGNFSGARLAQVTNNFFVTPTLSWEIDIWGKYRSANLAAKAELLGSEANLKAIQVELISAISNTYFLLLDYQERLSISKSTLKTRDNALQIMQLKYDKGVIPEIDLNQAQIQRSIAAAAIPFYTRMVAYTQNSLSILLGQYPGEITSGKGIMSLEPELTIPSGMPSSLLERRPDLLAAEQSAEAQNARIGIAIAQRFPSISLTGSLGLASSQLSSLTTEGLAWSAGASLLSPIFEFNKNKRRVEVEKARAEQLLLIYEQTALTAFKEVENALVEIETRTQELEAYEIQALAAMNAERLSQMRYDKGATSYLELLEAQRTAFSAQLQLSENTQALLNAYVNLYKALGGGWISKEEEQNANQVGQ